MSMRKSAAALAAITTLAVSLSVAGGVPAQAGATIKITAAYYDPNPGPDPDTNAGRNQEYIVIRNSGSRAMTLTGWVLHDAPRSGVTNKFVFPTFKLKPGKTVRIHTGSGTNSATDLYWGKTVYVWGDDSDTATLLKSSTVMSQCSWTSTDTSPKYC